MRVAGRFPAVEWAADGQPIAGESESGDLHVAAAFEGGALLGMIDGLGHGPEAAAAARVAAALLESQAERPLPTLIQACHEALRPTRGAVLSLAAIDARNGRLTWAGVGNVEVVLTRADPAQAPRRERILLRSGVVGYQLPALRTTDHAIFPGDVLVFATDGLRHEFSEDVPLAMAPAQLAEHLLRTYGRSADDATVLVGRYLGGAA
ncbi:MAG: SpoIIE family protein phosphatase [Caulobacterales bacterium]|nr:SpoIIE family protein phosphatase [Caulobacterales bacterium]